MSLAARLMKRIKEADSRLLVQHECDHRHMKTWLTELRNECWTRGDIVLVGLAVGVAVSMIVAAARIYCESSESETSLPVRLSSYWA